MSNLNGRIRLLEKMQPTQSLLDSLDPEQVAGILRSFIRVAEEKCAEGLGSEPLNWSLEAQTMSEALAVCREQLADWEREHDLASR